MTERVRLAVDLNKPLNTRDFPSFEGIPNRH